MDSMLHISLTTSVPTVGFMWSDEEEPGQLPQSVF